MKNNWHIETKAIQSGYSPENGAPRVVPIAQSTTFRYDDAASVAALFDLEAEGHIYTRLSNPTTEAFENKIAAMEKGKAAVATSSGQAAIMMAILNVCPSGCHFLAGSSLYGGSVSTFNNTFRKMGVEVTFFDQELPVDEILKLARPNTKLLYGEMLANPALKVLDLEKFSLIAGKLDIPLFVDNTFPSPYLCNPVDFGADVIVHSTSKYIDGHAVALGGIVVDCGTFNWDNGKFPEFTEPDESYHGVIYTKDFPESPFAVKLRAQWLRDTGATISPMNAFLSSLGTETLHLRMERHCQNALKLGQFLQGHKNVSWVNYPMLPDNSEYERGRKYLKGGSGVLTFGVKGGKSEGEKVMNLLRLAAIVVHVSDVRTGVLHPASMTHRQLTEDQQRAAGVTPDLIRVSVGIEHIDDIIEDFNQALNSI